MPAVFVKAAQHRLFQNIVEQIQLAILNGSIAPGEKLPAERNLAEEFGASRPTVREALRILEQKGLLEIRRGLKGGAYAREPNSELMAENLAMLIRTQSVSLMHLAEFRQGVEGSVAGLAAERATDNDVARLKDLLKEAKRLHDNGLQAWGKFLQIDDRIHREIASIAGNPLYSFVLHSIHVNIDRYFRRYLRAGDKELAENYRDLVRLIDAVERRDSAAAALLAREHVYRFNHAMEQSRSLEPMQAAGAGE